MSIATEIMKALPEDVSNVKVEKIDYHGESAVLVTAYTTSGGVVEGTFRAEEKSGFGGIEFNNRYDVVALMVHKIKSVLAGTAEGTK